jgi:Lrp/AsnC family transcriptional regulator, regulator for asnA, asnC and gidA
MADGKRRGDTPLDATSKQIIAQLQQDGRRPNATIGKKVGLSEAAVRQRVHRLLEQGTIQIVAVADPAEVGFARQAMVGITADRDLRPIADRLAEMDEVSDVVVTAGSFDLLAKVIAESDDQLLDLLSRQIRSIPGVRSTETFVYLQVRKETYSWGVR